jgi:hypothetical protein
VATLNLLQTLLAFGDTVQNSNPLRKYFDWSRRLINIPCSNPHSEPYLVPPQTAKLIFDGSRTTAIDGTTAFTTSKNAFSPGTYRFTNVAGTAPAFRIARALSLATKVLTFTNNLDGTSTFSMTNDGSNALTAIQVGDVLFIPGLTTGDTLGPFNTANEGAWTVLVAGSYSLVLNRVGLYSGVTETQTVTSNPQVIAFSAAGVQIADKVDVSAGFSPSIWNTYTITQVTASWFEISSPNPVPVQASITPGATGMLFYSIVKKWIRIETDQEIAARFNGDATNLNRISPVAAGDAENVGYQEKLGSVYTLYIYNRSLVPANISVWSVE